MTRSPGVASLDGAAVQEYSSARKMGMSGDTATSTDSGFPAARSSGLLTEAVDGELIVFDASTNTAHALDARAAAVWLACDGRRSVPEIACVCELDEEVVAHTLEQLAERDLLEAADTGRSAVSRRTLVRRFALVGAGVGVGLPLIASVAVPSAAAASSLDPGLPEGPGGGGEGPAPPETTTTTTPAPDTSVPAIEESPDITTVSTMTVTTTASSTTSTKPVKASTAKKPKKKAKKATKKKRRAAKPERKITPHFTG